MIGLPNVLHQILSTWCWLNGWGYHSSAPLRFPMVGISIFCTTQLHAWDMSCVDTHLLKAHTTTTTTIIQSGAAPFSQNHALSQVGGPTQSQLSRLMTSGHHISMEHRQRRKHPHLNSETHASNEIFLKKKRKKKKHIFSEENIKKTRK